MVGIIKTIILILILNQMIFSQPKPKVVSKVNKFNLTLTDTVIFLNIPDRNDDAIDASKFSNQVSDMNLSNRERAVVKEILAGNVPSFSRKLRPLRVVKTINFKTYELTFFTVCDYMAIGSDNDYLYMPMTPSTAQYLADRLNCKLPTKKMVDIIYNNAETKLRPQPIPPSDEMTTIPVFKMHTDSIKMQFSQLGIDRSFDNIIAGHKKDIIISNRIYSPDRNYDRVVIYGWHLSKNNPIQPVYNGHNADYADYSHGVRLISNIAFINGDSAKIDDILKDPNLSSLLSDEGIISKPYYPESNLFTSIGSLFYKSSVDFKLMQNYPNPFGEAIISGSPSTTIEYSITAENENIYALQIDVYDVLGRKIKTLINKNQKPGNYSINFDGHSLASGIYFYKLKIGPFSRSRKMILVR